MSKRGEKKRFMEFVKSVKQNPFRYYYIKSSLAKMKDEEIEVNTQDYNGRTLLHLALKLNNLRLFNLFLKSGVNPDLADINAETPLHRAVLDGKINFIRSLIKNGCEINITGEQEQSPLHLAVVSGNLDIIKLLVDSGADLLLADESNNLPIDYAIDEKDEKVIRYLLSKQEVDEERMNKIREIFDKKGE
ncbi:MAG: ankyrin repeat domain-containing protein [Bacilli bacterium]|jgi:ankyrin repeat protein|nr:ankyrin repeat domain-containing protein [Acholeplasmataceae bacterium]